MAQIQSPETYVDGQQVTATRLNNQTNGATLLLGAITDQTALTANTIATGDGLIIHDASASALRKATAGDILGSGLPVVTGSVTAVAGADLVVTPAATFKLDVAGPLEADSLNITGNSTIVGNQSVTGTLTVGGLVTFNATSAVKIPVGTTAERPATSVAGQFRYNTTLDTAEVYSGTEWKAAGGLPFDATGGNTIATVDGYKIHTFTASGTFTPSLTREGKVEYLVVGAGGAGTTSPPQGGGAGGGGGVLQGFLTIAKNTPPFTITVGSGASGTGTSSTFHSFTANGGSSGVGRTGGASGSGFAGGSPANSGAAGGGARSTEIAGRGNSYAGGIGGRGVGSFISGTYREYGGGGSGTGSGPTVSDNLGNSPEGVWGGGGRNVAPVANSGGGGGGGNTNVSASTGADGVVVIRYRVS